MAVLPGQGALCATHAVKLEDAVKPPGSSRFFAWSVLHLAWRVSCVLEVVWAFVGSQAGQGLTDGVADRVDRSRLGFSRFALELGEDLLDRIEVGRVFWKEDEARADRAQGAADRL